MQSRRLFLVWIFTLTILTTQSHTIHVYFIDYDYNFMIIKIILCLETGFTFKIIRR